MSDQEQLERFSQDLLQEVIASCENEDSGDFRINEFTRLAS